MWKLIFSLVFFQSVYGFCQPATQTYPYAHMENDIVINGGLSLIQLEDDDNYLNAYQRGTFPPINLTAEFGITQTWSLGFHAALFPRHYYIQSPELSFHANKYYLGIRSSLHFSPLAERVISQELDSENMDLYISGTIGYKNTLFYNVDLEDEWTLSGGAVAGMRYFFLDYLGLFAEAGYGPFAVVTVGLSGRF